MADRMDDRFEMLHPTERVKAEKFMEAHREKCLGGPPEYLTTSAVSGYGFRMRVTCQRCGAREDVTEDKRRDPGANR